MPGAGRSKPAPLRTGAAGGAALAVSFPVSAAPDNKNVQSFPVSCDGIEDTEVFSVAQSQSEVVFLADGQVLVAKHIAGEEMTTLSVEDGPTFTFSDSFEEGANGSGFEDQLMSCDFTLSFEFEFTADKRFVSDFDLDPSFIGATVHVTSTITGTSEVMMPGN